MSLRIEFHVLVDADLEHAWTWYEDQEHGLGDRFLDAIHATAVRASRWPNVGRPVLHDDDDEIVFKRPPPKAPQAMNGNGKFVVDPNQFGVRDTPPHKVMPEQYRYTRGGRPVFQRGGRGGSSPASNRVNGHSSSPRNITPVAPRQVPVAPIDITKPIDPDSYARPVNAKGMARGGRRRLWEPT